MNNSSGELRSWEKELKEEIEGLCKEYGELEILREIVNNEAFLDSLHENRGILSIIERNKKIERMLPPNSSAIIKSKIYSFRFILDCYGEKALKEYIKAYSHYIDEVEETVYIKRELNAMNKTIKLRVYDFPKHQNNKRLIETITIKGE